VATLSQIRANRENARHNTSARSSGGAGNARTHGLSASKCLSDEEKALIAERLATLERELFPEDQLQRDEVLTIATASIRLERCQLEEQDWRLVRCERAEFYWDADRQAEAMDLVQRLPRKPAVIQPRLLQTLRGSQWMLAGWRDLAGQVRGTAGESPRPLDEQGRRRAFDLLGLSEDRRVVCTPLDPPSGAGSDAAVAAHQDALITTQIAALDAHLSDGKVELDESNRLATIEGASPGVDNQTRLIRRYETEARRVKERAYANLKRLQQEARAARKEAEERQREEWVNTHLVPRRIARVATAPAPASQTVDAAPAEAAPVTEAAATEPFRAAAGPRKLSAFEDLLAQTADVPVRDPNALPISILDNISRRQRKAAARAAHRGVTGSGS
jgi:hypothetical protein